MLKLNRRQVLFGASGSLLVGSSAEAASRTSGFEVEEVDVAVRGLDPAHDGLRVVQLSDLHIGYTTPNQHIRDAVEATNAIKPDLVVLTGDYITHKGDSVSLVQELLRGIEAPTVGVLGNHDHWTYARHLRIALERNGVAVLQNAHTELKLKNVPFRVIGIDDSTSKHDDVEQTFHGVPNDGSRLVLTHTPSLASRLPEGRDWLCLSGHTHGGHFVIPGITWNLMRASGQRFIRGSYDVGENQVYVNRGLGFLAAPRVGSKPEVSVFTLRMKEPRAARSVALNVQ